MSHPPFACFYHPISILFLDDQPEFLFSVKFTLGKLFQVITVDNVSAARECLKNTSPNLAFLKEIDRDELDIKVSYPLDVDVSEVYKISHDSERFHRIGIAMVDYDMPGMDGLDFCRSLQDMNVMKVLITAEKDYAVAVKAFNEGVIDHFIQKNSPDLMQELITVIQTLTMKHFQKLSWLLMHSLGEKTQQFLRSVPFQDKFHALIKKYEIVEYYLLDRFGSFLFLDAKAKPYFFVVRTETELEEQLSLADNLEAPASVIEALRERKGFVFSLPAQELGMMSPAEWQAFLVPATLLSPGFYCAILENPSPVLRFLIQNTGAKV